MSIYIPDTLETNNPNVPLFLINNNRGFSIVETISSRDSIHAFKRSIPFICVISSGANKGVYSYIGSDTTDVNWENTANWQNLLGLANYNFDYIAFNTSLDNPVHLEGLFFYDKTDKALSYYNEVEDIVIPLGQKVVFRVFNSSGADIVAGNVVYPLGTTIGLADARYKVKSRLVAVASHDIPNGTFGYVTKIGKVKNLDTSAYTVGDLLYLCEDGNFGLTRQLDGGYDIIVGVVDVVGTTDGEITVDILGTELTVETTDTNGFPIEQTANTIMSIDNGTRTFSISAITGTYFHYYQAGEKYEQDSTQSLVFPDTEGFFWIYFDKEDITYIHEPTPAEKEEIVLAKAWMAAFYWDATNKKYVFDILNERHGISMSPYSHLYNHLTRGAQYVSGLSIGNILADQTGDLNTHAQFSVEAGLFMDEDIKHIVPAITVGTTVPVLYLMGSGVNLREGGVAGFGVMTTGSGRLAYNQFIGGAWQLTEVANGGYVLYHEFAINGQTQFIGSVMGQASYTTVTEARDAEAVEIANLITLLEIDEIIPIGTIIYQTNNGYTNAVKARIITNSEGDTYTDWRTSDRLQGATPASHINLTEKDASDQHPISSITGLVTALNEKAVKVTTPTTVQQLELQTIDSDGQYVGSGIYCASTETEFRAILGVDIPKVTIRLLSDITITAITYTVVPIDIIVEGNFKLLFNNNFNISTSTTAERFFNINVPIILSTDIVINSTLTRPISIETSNIDSDNTTTRNLALAEITLIAYNYSEYIFIDLISFPGGVFIDTEKGPQSRYIQHLNSNNLILSQEINKGVWNINTPTPFYSTEWISPLAYPTTEDWDPATEIDATHDYAIMPKFIPDIKDGLLFHTCAVCSGHNSFTDRIAVFRKSIDGGVTWTSLSGGTTPSHTVIDFFEDGSTVDISGGGFTPTGRWVLFMRRFVSGVYESSYVTYSDDKGITWSTPYDRGSLLAYTFDNRFVIGKQGELIMAQSTGSSAVSRGTHLISSFDNGETWQFKATVCDFVGNGFGELMIRDFGDGLFIMIARSANYIIPSGDHTGLDLPVLFVSRNYGDTWAGDNETLTESDINSGLYNSGWLPLEGLGVTLGDGGFQNACPLLERVDYNGSKFMLIATYMRYPLPAPVSRDEVLRLTAINVDEWLTHGWKAIKYTAGTIPVTAYLADNTLSSGQFDGNGMSFVPKNKPEMIWTICDNLTSSSTGNEIITSGRVLKSVITGILDATETEPTIT